MNRQKIVFYFTPDTSSGIRNLSWMQSSDSKKKGDYIIGLDNIDESIIIDANCNSIKSAQESTAEINIVGIYNGIDTDDIFFVNDYWEIWDVANNWCYFRGMTRDKNRSVEGRQRGIVLSLVNAGGWVFNDRSIFYINPVLASSFGATKSTLFNTVKTKYGLLNKDNSLDTELQKEIQDIFTKDTTPNRYLEFLVNKICNTRIEEIKKTFFPDSDAIKTITPEADQNFLDRRILVSRRKSQVEGAVWDALKMFEGYPFCQMYIEEGFDKTRIKWRYSRWRDSTGRLCIGDLAFDDTPIVLYADDKASIEDGQFKGMISKQENETISGIINAFFLTPWSTAKLSNSLVQQMSASPDQSIILDEDSIIRNGYNPQELKIPFIPESIAGGQVDDKDFDDLKVQDAENLLKKRSLTVGQELTKYSEYMKKMYTDYKLAKSGSLVFKENIPIKIGSSIELIEKELRGEVRTHMTLNKITQYFESNSPRTVLEYSRGFKRSNLRVRNLV